VAIFVTSRFSNNSTMRELGFAKRGISKRFKFPHSDGFTQFSIEEGDRGRGAIGRITYFVHCLNHQS
jgi:hypothetical protein